MLKLPGKNYVFVGELFKALELSDEEQKKGVEMFEEVLLREFMLAVMKKLPTEERKRLAEVANSAKTDEEKLQVRKKLTSWLNDKETLTLYQKVSERVFADLLRTLYKTTTEEKKKKLEEMFKIEVLKA